MQTLDRRRFLALGAAATAAALAGCSGGGSGDEPPHADWIPAGGDATVTAYVDFTVSEDSSEINPVLPLIVPDGGEGGDGPVSPRVADLEDLDDPLVTVPLRTGGQVVGLATLSFAVVGFGPLLDRQHPAEGVTELFVVDGVSVGVGDVDRDRAEELLQDGSETFPDQGEFEAVREGDDFTVYRLADGDGSAVAVGESAIVMGESRAAVEGAIDTWRGDRERAVDADDEFTSLLEAAGSGNLFVGWEGPADFGAYSLSDGGDTIESDLFSGGEDLAASVSFDQSAGTVSADLAVHDPDVDADELESRLGSAASERSVSAEGDRTTVSATYDEDDVGLEFVGSDGTTTPPRGDAVPDAVAEAVPEGAFEFAYDEENERVRVDFEQEVEADEVTISAVERGGERSTTTPGPIEYFFVRVDPAGDEVLVTVTVDGESGVVASHEVP